MSEAPTILEALSEFANPQNWAIRRASDGHPDAVWIGTYRVSPIDFAQAALAREDATVHTEWCRRKSPSTDASA